MADAGGMYLDESLVRPDGVEADLSQLEGSSDLSDDESCSSARHGGRIFLCLVLTVPWLTRSSLILRNCGGAAIVYLYCLEGDISLSFLSHPEIPELLHT